MSRQVADEGNGEQVKFKYEEHDNAHLFFTPYLWTQVMLFFLYTGHLLVFLMILCLILFSYLSTCPLVGCLRPSQISQICLC